MRTMIRPRKFGLRFVIVFTTLLVSSLLVMPSALAQTGTATVFGRVTDQSNAVMPDVEIEIKNVDTGITQSTKTNGDGIYSLQALPPGHYLMNVRKPQFRTVSVTGITLNVQDNVSRNFVLQVGSSAESVTVNGNAIGMNTTDAAVSTVIDRQFVANIPLNGRSFQDLLTLVPGVSLVPSAGVGYGGEITVNGQRTEANSFTVDGVDANVGTSSSGSFGFGAGFGGGTPAETALGTTQSMVSVDALQEFRATTSTYSAEYGRTPGGQFSFTTRSGTNDWHGSVFDYFRNEALDANNWFTKAEGDPREKERQNDFGGTLAGPIRIPHLYDGKDRTFFFFSYEGLRLWTPQGLSTSDVPDLCLRGVDPASSCTGGAISAPAELLPILNAFPLQNKGEDPSNPGFGIYQVGQSFPSSIDSVSVRVDHNFSDKFKVFGRYASTPSVTSSYNLAVKQNNVINNRLVTLGATSLITSAQANEFRFNITQANSISNSVSTTAGGATPFDLATLPGPNGGNLSANGSGLSFVLGFGQRPVLNLNQPSNKQRQFAVTDTYSWTLGRHGLKFGADWRRLATYATPVLVSESAYFASLSEILANNAGPDGGSIGSYSQSPSPVEPLYKNFSAFVQDEWRVKPRLSLSLGLRWDVNPAPTNLTGPSPYTLNQITNLNTAQLATVGTPLWKTDWHGFAPRIGGAYQVRQTPGQETVFRAGFGVFYDMGNTLGSNGFNGVGFSSNANFSGVSFPLTSMQMTVSPPSIAPPYNNLVYAFDPNLKLPYALQWNVALEQALGNKQALTMSYLGSVGRRLLETYFYDPATNPYFGSDAGGNGADITKNGPTSNYNALQAQFQRRVSHGLQALASYTYSHAIDDASSNFNLSDLLERASSDFDIRHNFQAALTYDVPGEYSNRILSGLLQHWAFDSRVTARSALPVDIVGGSAFTPLNGYLNFHPDLVAGQPVYLFDPQYPGGKIINYAAFSVPSSESGSYSEGDTPRNYARGFGAWQLNFAIRREFTLHERLHLQFRAEAFNLFNHPVFSGINNYWPSGPIIPGCLGCGFGEAGSTLNNNLGGLNPLYQTGGPRSLQLALKLIF